MTDQQKNSNTLPDQVQKNYRELSHTDFGVVAKMVNMRAGRVARFDPQAKTIIQQFNMIESELLEGKKAAARGDLTQVRDAIADIILIAAGQMGHIAGIDVAEDYKRMCAYNMTRISSNMQDAVATVAKYDKIGIEAIIQDEIVVDGVELYPVLSADKEQWDVTGEHYPPNKFLKSTAFLDAEYQPIDGVTIEGTGKEVQHLIGTQFTQNHLDLIKEHLDQSGLEAEEVLNLLSTLVGIRA